MRIAVLQHVHYEHLPGLDLAGSGIRLDFDRADFDHLPTLDAFDGLCVLGGPCNVDDPRHGWLAEERLLIADAVTAGKPVLAICMGAQQLTRVLGAAVVRNPVREIGWFPLRLTAAGRRSPLRHLDGIEVLHWHDDACELPAGAVLLADSEHCGVQAYAAGERLLALQFHAEWTAATVDALIDDGHLPDPDGRSIQPRDRLRSGDPRPMNAAFSALFREFFRRS
jgi:GMP synthase (glutamine-hydrolysing)